MSRNDQSDIRPEDYFSKNFFKDGHVSIQTSSAMASQDKAWIELMKAQRRQGFEPSTATSLPNNFNDLEIEDVKRMGAIMPYYKEYTLGQR